MELIGSGAQADIYKENNMAIKLFKKNVLKYDVEYEMNLQKMAFELGLPVPKIYDFIEINGKYGFEMEYINGIAIGNIILNDMNKLNEYLIKSIEIQINLNKIVTDKFPPMNEKLKRKIDRTKILNINEKQKILDILDTTNLKQNLCHGDFQLMNLMQTSNDIKIIDWVDSSSGNNEADACRTYLLYKVNHDEIAELFIENYCKIANISKDNILKWIPIIAAARLSEGMGNDENKKLTKMVRENI
jgi:thiamine kinase-like enzyme